MSAKNGSIILCHDAVRASDQTLKAVDQAIPQLKQKGLKFVTLTQLLSREIQAEQRDVSNAAISLPHLASPFLA
jgi:peptidoglycan/xylan/chitin deacetylase (PgdA/CDA1 family)